MTMIDAWVEGVKRHINTNGKLPIPFDNNGLIYKGQLMQVQYKVTKDKITCKGTFFNKNTNRTNKIDDQWKTPKGFLNWLGKNGNYLIEDI